MLLYFALLLIGMLILAFVPMVIILLGIQVVRRVGNYAVTRPAREMLFTQVTTDERFKVKPVIDIVVYRGGDAVSGSLFAGVAIASLWTWVAITIGKNYEKNS